MALAELRKKYAGKRVSESYANQHSIFIDSDTGDYEYFAEVTCVEGENARWARNTVILYLSDNHPMIKN